MLREAIRAGELEDPLPGGHELARRLDISRPSICVALAMLAAEGLIVVRQGCRSRLATRAAEAVVPATARVCVIHSHRPQDSYQRHHPIRLELRARLAGRGIRWEEVADPRLFGKNPGARIRRLVQGRRHTCWILMTAPEPTQRAFAEAGVPTLIIGTCHPGVGLPSADFDHHAVGVHAARTILGHGHAKIGLIVPADTMPGDIACRHGFLRVINQQAGAAVVDEIRAPLEPDQFRARLDVLLRAPLPPTVLFTMRQPLTLMALVHVLASGFQIPRDVSIVARDTHPLFAVALPELSCYDGSVPQLAARVVRIATSLLAGRRVAGRPVFITPAFVPGTTLANLRGTEV